ncbi:LamG domain-containing protein [bacterium]|nr:LamG domain-containing protein [bacterium]
MNDSKEVADGTNPTDASSYKSLSKGLAAYYPFSGNANDSSGNGNNGIPVSPVLSVDRLGASNAAYTFNGTSDRIDLANSAALNMNNGVPFSMSAWIKTDFNDGQRVILAKAAGAWGNTPALFVDNEGKLRFDNFEVSEVHSSTTVRTGNWMHVAVTYDGSTFRLFVNGVADGERAFRGSNELGNSWTFSIGGSLNTSFPSGMFKGSIDEVQFWSRTLSPAEVAGVVQASSPPANRAPVIAGQSTTYDALAEFVAGPTLQSANSRWQYLGGNVSALALLGNWKTTGNEIIQNQPQWDGNSGYLSNYPFVQRVNSAAGPTSANTLVIHPSNMEEANRAVAIGWKNTSSQTVAANFNVNLRLPYGSDDGIDYKLQRGLAGSPRYLSIRSGSLQAGGSVVLASEALVEMQAGEMLYLVVDSKNNFHYDHTEVSAFTVTVAAGASLDSISEGVASANNPGTAVTVLTAASSDADSDALKGIAITGVDTTHGSWEYTLNGGSVWNSLSGVNIASARLLKSDELHRVRFIPNASFSGNAEIQYRAWDQTSGEDGALADLTVAGGGGEFFLLGAHRLCRSARLSGYSEKQLGISDDLDGFGRVVTEWGHWFLYARDCLRVAECGWNELRRIC